MSSLHKGKVAKTIRINFFTTMESNKNFITTKETLTERSCKISIREHF